MCYLLSTHSVPDSVLPCIFSGHGWCPYFTDEETVPQEGNILHAEQSWQTGLEVRFLSPELLFQALGALRALCNPFSLL